MKFIKTYILQMIISIVFILIMLFFFKNQSEPTIKKESIDFNSYWTVSVGEESTIYKELPKKLEHNALSEVTFQKVLPTYIKSGDSVAFYTNHHSVRAYVDEVLIYEFKEKERFHSKTPGNAWHNLRLEKEHGGEVLTVVLLPSYLSVSEYIPDFQYGKVDALLGQIVKSEAFSLFLCVILFIMGVFIIVGTIFFYKQLQISRSLIWLGLFTVMVSLWSVSDINIIPLFIGHHLLLSQISFICLKLLFIPVIIFVREMYESKKEPVIDMLCILSILDFFVTILLQLLGILDLKETISFTHILFITAAIYIIFVNIKNLIKGNKQVKKSMQVHLISIVLVAVFACMDLIVYYMLYARDSGRFTKIGLLGYILILLYLAIHRSVKLINTNEQLDRVKEFAKRDAITQLSNRAAFEEEIHAIAPEDYLNYSVAIFDLNDLKEFNDLYGHSMGDYYIIISSEIIQDVFGKYGKVYRIGGDEFCAIMLNISLNMFRNLEDKMNKRMDGLNGMFFESKMSIASGYAHFNPNQDLSIHDTFQRADKNMYEHKHKMKHLKKS